MPDRSASPAALRARCGEQRRGRRSPAIRRRAQPASSVRATLNAFLDEKFVEAVKALGRPNLVIAGILTDVCLWHSAEAGYKVQLVADASGTTSTLADAVTYDRMRDLGITVGTTYGTLFELYPDLSTPEGQRAESVASGMPLAA